MIGERERQICRKRQAQKTLQFEATAPCATWQGPAAMQKERNPDLGFEPDLEFEPGLGFEPSLGFKKDSALPGARP